MLIIFATQMSKLNGSDDLGSYLINLVEDKEIATPDIAEVATSNGKESNGVDETAAAGLPAAPEDVSVPDESASSKTRLNFMMNTEAEIPSDKKTGPDLDE